MDQKKRNFVLVMSGISLYFVIISLIAVRLAVRDAEGVVDFIFKVFGAFMAFLFASAGPFGLIGLAVMAGKMPRVTTIIAFTCAGVISVLLILYVLVEFKVF